VLFPAEVVMVNLSDVIDLCRIPAGKKIKLKDFSTSWDGDADSGVSARKREARQLIAEEIRDLAEMQELLYASDSWSVLVIIQAMDAAGKDGTIKHVMSGINPQGVNVVSFKQPSAEELDHDFLWRCNNELPERGRIGIFNRSYYEEVLVVKVHPEILANQRIPDANVTKRSFWKARYKDINQFERHLIRNGTRIVKFFLNVSRSEQKKRFLERIDDPQKNWKFSATDLSERQHWDDYASAYEEMLAATSTRSAPWYVIPADEKVTAHLLVATILSNEIRKLAVQRPELTPAQHEALIECRARLEAEVD
jgi:PPK2 family polyphosphate:nucleotide phosphotransferase